MQTECLPAVHSIDPPHIWQLSSSSSSSAPALVATLLVRAQPHSTDAELLAVTRGVQERVARANERLRERGAGEVEVAVQVKRGER